MLYNKGIGYTLPIFTMNSARDVLIDQLPRIKNLTYEYFSIRDHRKVFRGLRIYDQGISIQFVRDPESGRPELHLLIQVNEEEADQIDLETWMDLSTECRMLIDAAFPGFDLIKIGTR